MARLLENLFVQVLLALCVGAFAGFAMLPWVDVDRAVVVGVLGFFGSFMLIAAWLDIAKHG